VVKASVKSGDGDAVASRPVLPHYGATPAIDVAFFALRHPSRYFPSDVAFLRSFAHPSAPSQT
jgi:hypothetical protein